MRDRRVGEEELLITMPLRAPHQQYQQFNPRIGSIV